MDQNLVKAVSRTAELTGDRYTPQAPSEGGAHRARAALRAISDRRFLVSFAARLGPPNQTTLAGVFLASLRHAFSDLVRGDSHDADGVADHIGRAPLALGSLWHVVTVARSPLASKAERFSN